MTETIRYRENEKHAQAMAYTTAADVLGDTEYDGSGDSILFILKPDGTHTIPPREVDRMVEVYAYPRLWPDLSDEHTTMRPASPRYAARAILYKEFGRIPKPKYSNEYLTERLYSGGQPPGGTYLPTGFGGYAFLPYDPHPSARLPKMKREKLPKARKKIVRHKWSHPRPKWKIDREMVRASVKKARRLEALDRARPVTYVAYTDGNGNKVREPSDYKPRPTTEMPRHPDYWEAYWTQWERRMDQLRRGKDDPKGWAVKLRNYIESRIDEAHYRKMARDGIFWRGVYERLQQQYDYACLERADEFGPEEFKKRYIEQTLPSEDGWRKIVTSTMPYVEVYPVVHVLSAFYGSSTESNLSAMECAGRRLMMYADLKKAARALMVTKPEIVAERLPAATRWAVDNFDGNILNFMGKVVCKLDAPSRKAGRRAAKDPASSESDDRALSLDRMKDDYDFEPEIEAGIYEGDPTEEYSVVGDVAEILAGRERYAELRGLVREHLKGDQRDWALLKLSGVEKTKELCKELDTDPNKLKRTAYAARAKLKKENRARKLYDDLDFSDVARLMGGGVRNPHKAGRGKAPRDLRPGAKRTKEWPVVGYAAEERLSKMGETVRPHRVRRLLRPAPKVKDIRDQRLIEYLTLWGSPTEDFETLGSYPSRWPLLRGRDSSAAYDPKKGRQSAGKFLMLMDRAKGIRHGRIGPLAGMNHRLKNDDSKFKDYSVAEKEIVEDGNYA